MKKLLVITGLVLACVLAGNFIPQHSSAKQRKFLRSVDPVPGRYIVVLKESGAESFGPNLHTEAASYQLAGEFAANVEGVYGTAVNGFAASMTEEAAIALSQDDRVAYVEEDAYVMAQSVQSGPTWDLDRLDQRNLPLNASYQYSTTGSGVHAYIIDSGIRTSHQEFGGRASVAADFVGDGQNGNDCYGHGTHVAGTVGSNTYGVAKGVSLHGIRVLACDGSGMVSSILSAVNWVTANRINPAVANISIILSGPSNSLDTAITNSISSGVTYTIASGNFGYDACNYSPARIPNAITVGSVAADDSRPPYSNSGACVDILAPGQAILSLSHADNVSTRYMNGTSMAAPHVAGVAALYLETNPNANPMTVTSQILNNATTGVVSNLDALSPNRLLYSWVGSAPPSFSPSRVTIIKQVITATGGTSSTTTFGYNAANLGTASFTLVDNNAPPSDRFDNPNVAPTEGAGDIVVTEGAMSGWNLNSIQCTETAGSGLTNLQNTTVDLANRRATIKAEQGETVTCTFTSQEIAPTASPASASGRVIDSRGRGLKGIAMVAQDLNTGATYSTSTSSFGYYSFNGLLTTRSYVIRARSKRYVFTPDSRMLSLSDSVSDVNFVSN